METEQQNTERNGVPFSFEGIGTRIGAVADILGTRKDAADIGGVSPDTLQRYIRDSTEQSFKPIARMALSAGVSLEWIATGKGPMMVADKASQGAAAAPALNKGLFVEIVTLVEEAVANRATPISPEKKGELVAYLYDEFNQDHLEHADPGKVVSLLKLIG